MLRRHALPYLMSADGGGGAGGPAAGSSASTSTGDAGTGTQAAAQPAAGVTFASQVEFDAAVKAQVEAATASTRAQVEAWQRAALDAHFDGLYQEHGIPEALRPVVRAQWEALAPGEDGHRPDPRTHLPEQEWFKAIKSSTAGPAARTRTGKSDGAPATPAAPATQTAAPASPAATTAPAQPVGLPPYVIRGPGSTAAPAATKPATTYAEAARVVAQRFRASP